MLKLAAIVGPTGTGKSRIAVKVAKELNGEIISCDSMQIYRGMDIGTAKIRPEETGGIPHHALDLVDPDQEFSVADYQAVARRLIKEINERSRLPILVGGTGLYYQAVVDDYELPALPKRPDIRQELNRQADELGSAVLYKRLQDADPVAAQKIKPNDRKRIVRALEVIEISGRKFSEMQGKKTNIYDLAAAGLILPRHILYRKLEERVDQMIKEGLVDEVRKLVERGYSSGLNSMKALGYAQIIRFLQGEITLEVAVNEIKRDTRRYAKRQITWFRRDSRITWFNLAEYKEEEVVGKICEYIRRTIKSSVE